MDRRESGLRALPRHAGGRAPRPHLRSDDAPGGRARGARAARGLGAAQRLREEVLQDALAAAGPARPPALVGNRPPAVLPPALRGFAPEVAVPACDTIRGRL